MLRPYRHAVRVARRHRCDEEFEIRRILIEYSVWHAGWNLQSCTLRHRSHNAAVFHDSHSSEYKEKLARFGVLV